MSRLQRNRSKSGYYHIMLRGNEKKSIFLCDDDKLRFVETVCRMKQDNRFKLYAFCLMDNHVHMLISEEDEDIAKVNKRITVSYVSYFNKKYKRVGHLFQDRYKSEVVTEDNYILTLARYIHQNPLKACVVKDLKDYKWSSYHGYLNENDFTAQIIDTEFILGMLSENKNTAKSLFISYMNKENDEDFMDIGEDRVIMEENEAVMLYRNMLLARGLLSGSGTKVEIPKDLLIEYKKETNFSTRKISTIVGLNKDKLGRILKDS